MEAAAATMGDSKGSRTTKRLWGHLGATWKTRCEHERRAATEDRDHVMGRRNTKVAKPPLTVSGLTPASPASDGIPYFPPGQVGMLLRCIRATNPVHISLK